MRRKNNKKQLLRKEENKLKIIRKDRLYVKGQVKSYNFRKE